MSQFRAQTRPLRPSSITTLCKKYPSHNFRKSWTPVLPAFFISALWSVLQSSCCCYPLLLARDCRAIGYLRSKKSRSRLHKSMSIDATVLLGRKCRVTVCCDVRRQWRQRPVPGSCSNTQEAVLKQTSNLLAAGLSPEHKQTRHVSHLNFKV